MSTIATTATLNPTRTETASKNLARQPTFDAELWQRIAEHTIGPAQSALTFTARLARDNGWSAIYATRVLQEYRRFSYLAVTCAHPVTPSDAVDQAWHLHLTYTRDYWQRFCPEVLGTDLHHGPTQGGETEAQKYGLWYAQTIASYESFFAELPPIDIWPGAGERFADPARFQRIDVRARRKPWQRVLKWASSAILLAVVFSFWPMPIAAQSMSINVFDWDSAAFLRLYGSGFFWMLAATIALRFYFWISSPASVATRALERYEEAYLSGDHARLVDVALVSMLQRGALVAQPDGMRAKPDAVGNDTLERSLLIQLRKQSVPSKMIWLKSASHVAVQNAEKSLVRQGLLLGLGQRWRLALICGSPLLLWLTLGLSRMAVGVYREKPIIYLGMWCLLTFLALVFCSRGAHKRTRAGTAYLKSLTKVYERLARAPLPEELARGVALFGISCLMFTPLSLYADWRRTPDGGGGDSGTSGSSSDSSSDGGGSGCGGCGGGGD